MYCSRRLAAVERDADQRRMIDYPGQGQPLIQAINLGQLFTAGLDRLQALNGRLGGQPFFADPDHVDRPHQDDRDAQWNEVKDPETWQTMHLATGC